MKNISSTEKFIKKRQRALITLKMNVCLNKNEKCGVTKFLENLSLISLENQIGF